MSKRQRSTRVEQQQADLILAQQVYVSMARELQMCINDAKDAIETHYTYVALDRVKHAQSILETYFSTLP